jgi:hypothetical protein
MIWRFFYPIQRAKATPIRRRIGAFNLSFSMSYAPLARLAGWLPETMPNGGATP